MKQPGEPRAHKPLDKPADKPDPLAHLNKIAHWLDSLITVPGTRISVGLDPLIGLVPGIGDIITALLSGYLVWFAVRQRVPRPVLVKMLSNIAIDCTAGAVPVVGDLFDVSWRANKRNLALLRSHLETPERPKHPGKRWLRLLLATLIILALGVAGAMISLAVMNFLTGA